MGVLRYKNYIGSVEYSEQDKVLFGKVQGIRGLISYQGETVQELEQDFREAINDYLEVCKEKNLSPQKSFTGAFNVRISSDLHREIVLLAQEEGITLNAFVKDAITAQVKRLAKRKKGSSRKTEV